MHLLRTVPGGFVDDTQGVIRIDQKPADIVILSSADDPDHHHDEFDSVVVSGAAVSRETVIEALQQLVDAHTIYRVKGFAALPGAPMRLVVQGVGRRFDSYFDRRWNAQESAAQPLASRFVLIGEDLDGATLQTAFDAALASVQTAGAK